MARSGAGIVWHPGNYLFYGIASRAPSRVAELVEAGCAGGVHDRRREGLVVRRDGLGRLPRGAHGRLVPLVRADLRDADTRRCAGRRAGGSDRLARAGQARGPRDPHRRPRGGPARARSGPRDRAREPLEVGRHRGHRRPGRVAPRSPHPPRRGRRLRAGAGVRAETERDSSACRRPERGRRSGERRGDRADAGRRDRATCPPRCATARSCAPTSTGRAAARPAPRWSAAPRTESAARPSEPTTRARRADSRRAATSSSSRTCAGATPPPGEYRWLYGSGSADRPGRRRLRHDRMGGPATGLRRSRRHVRELVRRLYGHAHRRRGAALARAPRSRAASPRGCRTRAAASSSRSTWRGSAGWRPTCAPGPGDTERARDPRGSGAPVGARAREVALGAAVRRAAGARLRRGDRVVEGVPAPSRRPIPGRSRTPMPEVAVPVCHVTGWWDFVNRGSVANFQSLRQLGDPALRDRHRLVIGPWSHEPGAMAAGTGAVPYGPVERVAVSRPDRRLVRPRAEGRGSRPAARVARQGVRAQREPLASSSTPGRPPASGSSCCSTAAARRTGSAATAGCRRASPPRASPAASATTRATPS